MLKTTADLSTFIFLSFFSEPKTKHSHLFARKLLDELRGGEPMAPLGGVVELTEGGEEGESREDAHWVDEALERHRVVTPAARGLKMKRDRIEENDSSAEHAKSLGSDSNLTQVLGRHPNSMFSFVFV